MQMWPFKLKKITGIVGTKAGARFDGVVDRLDEVVTTLGSRSCSSHSSYNMLLEVI